MIIDIVIEIATPLDPEMSRRVMNEYCVNNEKAQSTVLNGETRIDCVSYDESQAISVALY